MSCLWVPGIVAADAPVTLALDLCRRLGATCARISNLPLGHTSSCRRLLVYIQAMFDKPEDTTSRTDHQNDEADGYQQQQQYHVTGVIGEQQ
jgi:hypothetical protein